MPQAKGKQRRPMVRPAASGTRRRAAQQARAGVLRSVSQPVPRPPSSKVYTYANPGPVGKVGRLAGRALGSYFGGPLGGVAGEALGGMAHYIGKVFGSGDYITNADRVKKNVLVNDAQIPQFGSGANTVHIKHREFLGDIVTSSVAGAFQIQKFPINPGQFLTFPWLSQVVGSSFQQYRINGMLFEYRTMSADALNSVNTALGSVVMATDYDSADSAFTTKAQMENTEFGVSCKPSCSMIHAIECARSQTAISELYIRPLTVPANADIRLYDMGQFYIATTGFQGTSVNIGELWVSYDITFFKAIQLTPGLLIPTAHYQLDNALVGVQPLALTSPQPSYSFDNIGLGFPSGGLSMTFPWQIPIGSWWMISYTYATNAGGAANATNFPCTPSNGLVAVHSFTGGGGLMASPNPSPGTAVRAITIIQIVQYQGGATPTALPTITVVNPAVPLATYLNCDLVVTMINGQYRQTA